MYKQTLAAFVMLLGSRAAAAAQTAPVKMTCPLPAIADTVALTQVPGSDLMTVPVEINGKPKQFLLNIGTNASEVSQATVDELHLIEGIKRTETFQSGPAAQSDASANRNVLVGATVQATLVDVKGAHNVDDGRARVNIPSFAIGDATGKNLSFVIATDGQMGKSEPYDGLMTGSFFKEYDLELDFGGKKLNYLTPTNCADSDQAVFWPHAEVATIPMTIFDGKMHVQVNINGHTIDAAIDTSSAHSVMRRDIAELLLGLKANTPSMMPDGDREDGLGMQIYRSFLPQISFAGGVTAINVPVLIQTNSLIHHMDREPELGSHARFKNEPRIPDLTLGMDVLHQLHLYVLYGQEKLYVTSAE
jgi:hypothetical protein